MPTPLAELPIRRLTMGDLASCLDLAENRDWPREENLWRLLLTAGTVHGLDDPAGDGLAATCTLVTYGSELGAIGMMLVARDHGRQGLGQRMMAHVMRESEGMPLALYATPFGRPLYERLGFTAVGQNVTVRGRLVPGPSRPASEVTVRPASADDLPALITLDNVAFGVDRTLMITRLPAFTDRIMVAVRDAAIIGYAAIRRTVDTDMIGPLIAIDADAAEALVIALGSDASRDRDRTLRIEVDGRHEDLLVRFKEHGLDVVRVSTIMSHGIPELPGDWTRRYAPLSLATC